MNEYLNDEQLAERVNAAKLASENAVNNAEALPPSGGTTSKESTPIVEKNSSETQYNTSSNVPFEQPQKQANFDDEKPLSTGFEHYEQSNADKQAPVDIGNVLAPLKVHGRPFEVQNLEELRSLAQRGVDYTQKSQQLAADRKYIRTLEEYGLKDFNKLSFAIDLLNKKPEAVAKFFKDNDLDPIAIDLDEARNYTPTNVAGNPALDKFEMVVDTIKSDPKGEGFLSDLWARISNDAETKQKLIENPRALANMYNAKRSGLYDAVIAELDREELYDPISRSEAFLDRFTRLGERYVQRQTEMRKQQAAYEQQQQIANAQYARAAYPANGVFSSGYETPRVPLAIGRGGNSFSNLNETARRLVAHNNASAVDASAQNADKPLTDTQLAQLIRARGVYSN